MIAVPIGRLAVAAALLLAAAVISMPVPSAQGRPLPYDSTNPVMYDNDWTNDYVDWYLMALASAGDISYRRISTSSPLTPQSPLPPSGLDEQVRLRASIVASGRASGFSNVPHPIPGTRGHLVRPRSGRIEDTARLDSAGTRELIAEARRATPDRPLVVVLGGPLTIAADAYLLEPSIADRVVVAWTGGGPDRLEDYNGRADPWAAYIVLERMRLVQFPVLSHWFPRLTKDWIAANLPDTPARRTMLKLELDVTNAGTGDADGMPAVSVRRPDYVQAVRPISFAGWSVVNGREVPQVRFDSGGRARQVIQADGAIASQEYQRAFLDRRAWGWRSASSSHPGAGPSLDHLLRTAGAARIPSR